ncbi:MAG: tetratricopeptide repeat protein [Candidatus Sericytochromatia bacterium]
MSSPSVTALCQAAHSAYLLGNWREAQEKYQQALSQDPHHSLARLGLAEIALHLQASGDIPTLIAPLLKQLPKQPQELSRLGDLLFALKDYRAAHLIYSFSLKSQPDQPEVLNQVGLLLIHSGELEEAHTFFHHALNCDPEYSEARHNLGLLETELGRFELARQHFEAVLKSHPHHSNAWNSLANLFKGQKEYAAAQVTYRQALNYAPDQAFIYANLATVFQAQNQQSEAESCYTQAIQLKPDFPFWALCKSNLSPPVFESAEAIGAWKAQWLAQLRNAPLIPLARYQRELQRTNAFVPIETAYQGHLDLCEIRSAYANCFIPPAVSISESSPRAQPRAAILVTEGHEGVFFRCCGAWLSSWQSSELELFIIGPRMSLGHLKIRLDNPHLNYLPQGKDFQETLQALRYLKLDLLYYWEVGTDSLNYFLPFFRPARLQLSSIGFPVTSGIPQMDGFIVGKTVDHRQYCMSEKILTLAEMPVAIEPLPPPNQRFERSDYGLQAGWHLYLCPHNLLKLHPDFDHYLAEILREDPLGHLILIQSKSVELQQALEQRWQSTLADGLSRIHFLPALSQAHFHGLMQACEVMLDTLYYCSGVLLYEALALGLPVVSQKQPLFSAGMTPAGVFAELGMDHFCAHDRASYVALALKLSGDRDYRKNWIAHLNAGKASLYKPQAVAKAHEKLFLDLFLTKT